jgi:hypothetical protein
VLSPRLLVLSLSRAVSHCPRDLRGAEHAVQALVDRYVLADSAGVRVGGVDLPARVPFDERQGVRAVAVHLVGRREHERRRGRVAARGLEHRERAHGIHTEVGAGIAGSPVVGRLRRGVDDGGDRARVPREGRHHRVGVADVARDVRVPGPEIALKPEAAVGRRRAGAEELAAHVVVDADDVQALRGETAGGFGPD